MSLGHRLLIWLVVVACAAGTGLFWAGQRRARTVDATVQLSVAAELAEDGTLSVEEEILVLEPGGTVLRRVLVAPDGMRLQAVEDAAGDPLPHTAVDVADGSQIAVPIGDGPTAVRLRYDLLDAGRAGEEAGSLEWIPLDDRNPLAIEGLAVDLTWQGGEPIGVEVEAPGDAAAAVPADGVLRLTAGTLPAHHLVEVHVALPAAALPAAMAEDRPGMAAMAEGGAGGAAAPVDAGGGPTWLPIAVALAYLASLAVAQRAHGRDPDVPAARALTAPPGPQTPAEVAWLLRRGAVREHDLAVTVAHLHERGVIRVTDETWELVGSGPDAVAAHEEAVLAWAFAAGPVVAVDALVAGTAADPSDWRTAKRAFEDAVDDLGRRAGVLVRTVESESVVGAGVAALAVIVLGVVGTALGQPAWLACVAAGGLGLVSMEALARRSPEGAVLAASWAAFGTHLWTDPEAAAAHAAHGTVLRIPAARTEVVRRAVDAVDAVEHAYLGATSYLAAPRRRPD